MSDLHSAVEFGDWEVDKVISEIARYEDNPTHSDEVKQIVAGLMGVSEKIRALLTELERT